VLPGIIERDCTSDGNVGHRRNAHQAELASASPGTQESNPELAGGERETGKHHELRKVAPRDVIILRDIDGKIMTPFRLILPGSPVRSQDRKGQNFRHDDAPSCYPMTARATDRPDGPDSIAAVTSMYSLLDLGTIMFTFVVMTCDPKRNRFIGRAFDRSFSICSRGPKYSAWLGHTLAHMGFLPTEVRS